MCLIFLFFVWKPVDQISFWFDFQNQIKLHTYILTFLLVWYITLVYYSFVSVWKSKLKIYSDPNNFQKSTLKHIQ